MLADGLRDLSSGRVETKACNRSAPWGQERAQEEHYCGRGRECGSPGSPGVARKPCTPVDSVFSPVEMNFPLLHSIYLEEVGMACQFYTYKIFSIA